MKRIFAQKIIYKSLTFVLLAIKTVLKFTRFDPPTVFTFFCGVTAVSLIFSPFVLSIGMWGICVVALWNRYTQLKQQGTHISRDLGQALCESLIIFKNKPAFFLLTLLFWVVFISGLWSSDTGLWLERVRLRLPFLVLPWAFANAPQVQRSHLEWVGRVLVYGILAAMSWVLWNYTQNRTEILAKMLEGQPIPVPRNHIRFSLTVAFGVFTAGWIAIQPGSSAKKWIFGGLSLFLFGFLHFLAVRSGLFAFYLSAFVLLIWLIFFGKIPLSRVFIGIVGLMLGIYGLFQYLPSLSNRVAYMRWDTQQFLEGRTIDGSDAGRLASLVVGWEIFKENPAFGVGAGDLYAATKSTTERSFPQIGENFKLPHNQYLFIAAGTGFLGLFSGFLAFFGLFYQKKYRSSWLLLVFTVLVHSSFLFEYTIETSIGVAFYLFFTLFLMFIADQKE